MKAITSIKAAVLLVFLLGTGACCTKKDCDTVDGIRLHRFPVQELDSVLLYRYVMNSGFSSPVDSLFVSADPQDDSTASIFLPYHMNTGHEYRLVVQSSGRIFLLTGLEYEQRGCNACFPYTPESDYYYELSSYQVNGDRQFGNEIAIHY